jgi:hypothetical protein
MGGSKGRFCGTTGKNNAQLTRRREKQLETTGFSGKTHASRRDGIFGIWPGGVPAILCLM